MKRVYIAGPMTGYPELNFPAFRQAARELRAAGLEVVSPAEINGDPAAAWGDCMRADIAQLVTCTDICMLPGWANSKGARLELSIARALGMGIGDKQQYAGQALADYATDERAAVAAVGA